jgi:hypothetical protein
LLSQLFYEYFSFMNYLFQVLGTSQSHGDTGYGAISYEITGGSGKYFLAYGWMVDIFLASNNAPTFEINAWGVFWVVSLPTGHDPALPRESQDKHAKIPNFLSKLPKKETNDPNLVEYAMSFLNRPANGVNHATANSQSLLTKITDDGFLSFDQKNSDTEYTLQWTSFPKSFPNGTFSNTGVLDLMDTKKNNSLGSVNFVSSSLGQAREVPGGGLAYGGITYWISGGKGIFSGATGVMIDIFVAADNAETNPVYAWGLFWI